MPLLLLFAMLTAIEPVFGSEIHTAVKDGNLEKIKALVKAKPGWLKVTFEKRRQPLHEAAVQGQTEAAALLLELGSDIQALDADGETALHLAAWSNGRDAAKVVKLLLEKGVAVDTPTNDSHKWTPLHRA